MKNDRSFRIGILGSVLALVTSTLVLGATTATAAGVATIARLGYPGTGASEPTIGRSDFYAQHGYLTRDIPAYEAAKATRGREADARWASLSYRRALERHAGTPTRTSDLLATPSLLSAGSSAPTPLAVGDRQKVCNTLKTILGTRTFCLRFPKERPFLLFKVAALGLGDNGFTPSDSTGAVGPTRYVQMVNTTMGIFDRTGTSLAAIPFQTLTGDPNLSDPQVIWDAATNRFYFSAANIDVSVTGPHDGVDMAFGFSTTDSPSTAADWCTYSVSLGYDSAGSSQLFDQPHLGDTQNLVLLAGDVFDFGTSTPSFVSDDMAFLQKPPAGTTCPASLAGGKVADLVFPGGAQAFSTVAVNQIDPNTTGWLVSADFAGDTTAKRIGLFQVTESGGGVTVATTGTTVSVSAYGIPPNAPQLGSTFKIDTLDARLTQAVSGIDPSSGELGIWTQHAVAGGAGSEVRWYEIDPTTPSLLRSGKVTHPVLFVFNGAVTNDRAFASGVGTFGDTMMIGFNTSSKVTDSSLWTISQSPSEPISPWVQLAQSPGPNEDFTCTATAPCRWGDYMGASPDPVLDPSGTHGSAWFSGTINGTGGTNQDLDWFSVIAQAAIDPSTTSPCTFSSTVTDPHLIGSNGDDSLCAGVGKALLEGLGGADFLLGGAGNDDMFGSTGNDAFLPEGGNDSIDGGTGHNFLAYIGEPGPMKIDLVKGLATGDGRDTLSGISRILGSDGADTIVGTSKSEELFGSSGKDTILGGLGFDFIAGGTGNDFLDGGFGQDSLDGQADRDTCVRDPNVVQESQDLFSSCERFVIP